MSTVNTRNGYSIEFQASNDAIMNDLYLLLVLFFWREEDKKVDILISCDFSKGETSNIVL